MNQTLTKALKLSPIAPEGKGASAEPGPVVQTLMVQSNGRRIKGGSQTPMALLAQFFSAPVRAGELPSPVGAWLRARRRWLSEPELAAEPSPELVVDRKGRRLVVRLVALGDTHCVLMLTSRVALVAAEATRLTAREREVVYWAAEGKRDAEIAMILGISPRTVSKHLENLFRKLRVETRTAAVREWREARTGWDSQPAVPAIAGSLPRQMS